MTTLARDAVSEQETPAPHGVLLSVFLHLLPGAASMALFVLLMPWAQNRSLPVSFLWVVVVNLAAFYPILFGTLMLLAKRRGNLGFSLAGVVAYRERLSVRRTLALALMLVVLSGGLVVALEPVSRPLEPWFEWLPRVDGDGVGPTAALPIITFGLSLLFTGVATPIGEELYYRGYLLPRMPSALGRAGPLVHSFLFAVQHMHSPWLIVNRTIGLLPLVYCARWTRSILPGILAHAAVNLADLLISASRTGS